MHVLTGLPSELSYLFVKILKYKDLKDLVTRVFMARAFLPHPSTI